MAAPTKNAVIDVIIPLCRPWVDPAPCFASVLAHTDGEYRLVLVDDACPDPTIGASLGQLAQRAHPQVVLLRNERPQGRAAAANRGIANSRGDVVLLDPGVIVTKGWLGSLTRCAASDPQIGTITPFSNGDGVVQIPGPGHGDSWREGDDLGPLREALARAAVPTYPSLPAGGGLCLYVRRELIDAIGGFDPAFGPVDGIEIEFCARAQGAGYRTSLCDDALVVGPDHRHAAAPTPRSWTQEFPRLQKRHPRCREIRDDFIARDPLRPLRDAALTALRVRTGPARGVLHVLNSHGGGTERHVLALIDASRARHRHYVAIATGDLWQVEDHVGGGCVRTFEFRRLPAEGWPDFLRGMAATFGIDVVHVHNISGCREGLHAALAGSGLPYGYTVHDLGFACPTIILLGTDGLYCGGETDPVACTRCLDAQPAFKGTDIVAWRAGHRDLLANSAFLIAPSQWAAATLARYFPERAVEVIPHGAPTGSAPMAPDSKRPVRTALALPDDDVPSVAVLGAIGPHKGARRLERMVELVRHGGTRVRFVVIGYLDVQHGPWQTDDALLTVHGPYDSRELSALLDRYRVGLVAYPSAAPETFSYTLSEAWTAGRPVVVPPIGALAARVAGSGAGWVFTEDEWRNEAAMLARIAELVTPANAGALAYAAQHARAIQEPTIANMVKRTLALYDAACTGRHGLPEGRAFAAERVRDALGYAPWSPPVPAAAVGRPSGAVRAATGWRQTLVGRALRRVMPAAVRNALRRKLN